MFIIFACLTYHKLGAGELSSDTYTISKAIFEEHLHILTEEGFDVIDCLMLRKILDGNVIKARRFVAITFDDGHKSNLDAAEILGKYNFKGTFFLTTNLCRNGDSFLTIENIKSLSKHFEVGTHGSVHVGLTTLSPQELDRNLLESKNWLEEITRKNVISMSLPGGYYNSRVVQQVFNSYKILGTSNPWYNELKKKQSHYLINRMAVRSNFDYKQFRQIINLSSGFYMKRTMRKWVLALPKQILRVQYRVIKPY